MAYAWPALSFLGRNEAEWHARRVHRSKAAHVLGVRKQTKAEAGAGGEIQPLKHVPLFLQMGPTSGRSHFFPVVPSIYESMCGLIQSALRVLSTS